MSHYNFLSHFYILILVVTSMAFIVTIYYCIGRSCQNINDRDNSDHMQQSTVLRLQSLLFWRIQQERDSAQGHGGTVLGLENSKIELIPRQKFEKGKGILDAECTVCLSEFVEGEEIRTLPECLHSFHVACIDMWLHSHPNCPICRANALPPSSFLVHPCTEWWCRFGIAKLRIWSIVGEKKRTGNWDLGAVHVSVCCITWKLHELLSVFFLKKENARFTKFDT